MQARNRYVPRVNQIDAINLNGEMTKLIRGNILQNLQAISPVVFVKIQPELDLIIQSAIWFGSVGKRCSTFGQQLLVLTYDSERLTSTKLFLHFCLTVLPSYIKNLEERCSNRTHERLNKATEYTGRKPTLIDFFLGLDYISLQHNQRRDIGYKYLTRELLWGGFMEIIGLLLPIINFRKLQRVGRSFIRLKLGAKRSDGQHPSQIKPELLHSTTCAYCGDRPTLPHCMGCEHIYCYYCLSSNIATDSKFCCVICDSPLTNEGIQAL